MSKQVYCVSVNDPKTHGWLRGFNIEAHKGRGSVQLTSRRECAMLFGDAEAVFRAYHSIPKSCPVRPDGKPNKPLTAFHFEILGLKDSPLI